MERIIRNNHGFTMIELVLLIIIIGILAVAVVPKFDLGTFDEDAEATLFISHLRYAQHRSMVTGGGWNLSFSGSSYTLRDHNNVVQPFPDGNTSVSVNAISSSRNPLYFDYLGTPDDDAISSNSNGVTSQTIISIGGQTIRIEPYTGGVL